VLAPTARFCAECGRPVSTAGPPRFAAPTAYTPRHLAEKIITSRAALEGERKQVTVHHGLGKLHRRTGQHDQARKSLATAITIFTDMGMAHGLEMARAEVATL
jgi:hypothetical protein